MATPTPALVSVQWLADALQENLVGPKLRILDTSWFLPIMQRDPKAEFAQRHIPGSSFFDIDECRDESSEFDHMLPTAGDFSRYVGDLGIGNDTHVVVYDTSDFGSFTAPRVWWMFLAFGHAAVSVLDGGMKNWLDEGFPVTAEVSEPERRQFQAAGLNQAWVKSYEDVLDNTRTKEAQIVDVRTPGRFRGIEPEPRADGGFSSALTGGWFLCPVILADILPGHILGSTNIPFTAFLDPSGKELGAEDLSRLFRKAGVDLERPLWATCGSGVTACHVALAAHLLGHHGVCVYDGSWYEWFKRASPEQIITEGEGNRV